MRLIMSRMYIVFYEGVDRHTQTSAEYWAVSDNEARGMFNVEFPGRKVKEIREV